MSSALVVGGTRGIGRVIASRLLAQGYRVDVVGREHVPIRKPCEVVVFAQRGRGDCADPWARDLTAMLTRTFETIERLPIPVDGMSIVVIGSALASVVGVEQPASYHVAKAGLLQLVRYFAVKLGPRGVRVNAVSPGATVKPESEAFYAEHSEITDRYRELCPLGRMATADDVADAVLFLASPQAKFISGHNLVLDGGISCVSHETLARLLLRQ